MNVLYWYLCFIPKRLSFLNQANNERVKQMNIELAKIAIDKMAFFIPEDVLSDLYKDHDATADVLAQDENRVVFSIVYHDKKDKRILSITVKRNEINVHYNGTMQVFSHRIDELFYNDVLSVLFNAQDTQPVKINQVEKDNMSNMINIPVEFVIDALQARYDDVKELWGCQASYDLWEQALQLVEECGLGSNITSPSAYVDNYLVNGEFVSKEDDEGYWIAETSLDGQITALIDQMHTETDQNEIANLQNLISDLITDAWDEYCEDNAIVYNGEYACIQF